MPGAPATPSLIQHVQGGSNPANGDGNTGNNYKVTVPNTSLGANTIILPLSFDSGSTLSSIKDNFSNSYSITPAVSADPGAGNMLSGIWVIPNVPSGVTTFTVTFSANVNDYSYEISEFCRIATSSPVNGTATTGSSPVTGPNLSFPSNLVPGNNDANGGNLIYVYFSCSTQVSNSTPTSWVPGGSFSLLGADIGWVGGNGMPHATMSFVQTTHAPINPSITATGDSADSFNCVAVALKAANAGTPRPAGMRIVRIGHASTGSFPAGSGAYKLQNPCDGNLRVMIGPDPNTTITGITDTGSGSWSQVAGANNINFWFAENASADNSLVTTLSTSGGDAKQSWRFLDIQGAATSNVVDTSDQVAVNPTNNSFNDAPTMSPTSATGGIMIVCIGLGQGPGTGFASGSPSNAIFDFCTYTGEVDLDNIENADLMGHASYPPGGGTYNWNWTCGVNTSGQGGAVAFKSG